MDINQLTRIFCQIDDFCKQFHEESRKHSLPYANLKNKRGPKVALADSEIMTILVAFQSSGYRHFKAFYSGFLKIYFVKEFPNLPSYQRFIELIPRVIVPLCFFAQYRNARVYRHQHGEYKRDI